MEFGRKAKGKAGVLGGYRSPTRSGEGDRSPSERDHPPFGPQAQMGGNPGAGGPGVGGWCPTAEAAGDGGWAAVTLTEALIGWYPSLRIEASAESRWDGFPSPPLDNDGPGLPSSATDTRVVSYAARLGFWRSHETEETRAFRRGSAGRCGGRLGRLQPCNLVAGHPRYTKPDSGGAGGRQHSQPTSQIGRWSTRSTRPRTGKRSCCSSPCPCRKRRCSTRRCNCCPGTQGRGPRQLS